MFAPKVGEGAANCNRKNALIGHGKSDYLIVLRMAGNAAGRKEVTYGHAKRGDMGRAQ